MAGRRIVAALVFAGALAAGATGLPRDGRAAPPGQPTDWGRFMHYPYVYYPHNFQRPGGSYDSLYYRYGEKDRIPVYNKNWYNAYPNPRPYHSGHHFILDVF